MYSIRNILITLPSINEQLLFVVIGRHKILYAYIPLNRMKQVRVRRLELSLALNYSKHLNKETCLGLRYVLNVTTRVECYN